MMSLVSRLRGLVSAGTAGKPILFAALREAADALEKVRIPEPPDSMGARSDLWRVKAENLHRENIALRAKLADVETEFKFENEISSALQKERDKALARVEQLGDAVATLKEKLSETERLRDAYKKAKMENDERFMNERDEARAKVLCLETKLAKATER